MYIAEKGLVESLILLSEQNIALYLVGYVPKDTYRIVGNLGCGLERHFFTRSRNPNALIHAKTNLKK